jgi:hypothetical protein
MKNTTNNNIELKFRFDDYELVDGKPTYDVILELWRNGEYQNEFEVVDKVEMEDNSHLNDEVINEIIGNEFIDYLDSFHSHLIKKYSIK